MMKSLLVALFALGPSLALLADNDPRDEEKNQIDPAALALLLPQKAKDLKITGTHSVTYDSQTGILRLTGRVRVEQGNAWIEATKKDMWIEVLPGGDIRTSKGRWRGEMKAD